MNNSSNSYTEYSGTFYIEVGTIDAMKHVDLVRQLNEGSARLINYDGYCRWEMSGLGESLKAVLVLQEKKVAFRFTGEGDILFIEQRS